MTRWRERLNAFGGCIEGSGAMQTASMNLQDQARMHHYGMAAGFFFLYCAL